MDALITQGAHFLGMTKKELVANAVRTYLGSQRDELAAGLREAMSVLDGTNRSRLALLTGLTAEEIDEVGGIRE